MLKLRIQFLIFSVLLVLNSCSGDNSRFVGRWKINTLDSNGDLSQYFPINDNSFIEFDSDKGWNSNKFRGNWMIIKEKKQIEILFSKTREVSRVKLVGKYKFIDEKLKIDGDFYLTNDSNFRKTDVQFYLELSKIK